MTRDLTTAKEVLDDAPGGVVGIDGQGYVFGGYDLAYNAASDKEKNPGLSKWGDALLPPPERVVLADEMIRRWEAYKKKAEAAE